MSNTPSPKSSDPKQLESGLDIEIPHDNARTKKKDTNANGTGNAANTPTSNTDSAPTTKTSSSSSTTATTNANTAQSPTKPIKFTTDKIGQWKSSQGNPFAEQNRKQQAKKAKQSATKKKIIPIIAITTGAAVVVAAVVALVIMIISTIAKGPAISIAGSSKVDVAEYENRLNEIFSQNPDAPVGDRLEAVQNAVDRTLDTKNGQEHKDEVLLAQTFFYFNEGLYYSLTDMVTKIDADKLDINNKQLFYNLAYYGYSQIGEEELADEYFEKLKAVSDEIVNQQMEEGNE